MGFLGWFDLPDYCILNEKCKSKMDFICNRAGIAIAFHWEYVVPFILGAIVGDLYWDNKLKLFVKKGINIAVFAIGVYLQTVPLWCWSSKIYIWLLLPFSKYFTDSIWHSFGAAFVIVAVINSDTLKKILNLTIFQWGGKLSYPIYAFHWPIICSISAGGILF